ncbi:MAG TPA: PEGA domain-containing protein [Vicinamibacterales bacterium]|nr:PEGA domain-containing protein [Vicinamibacterales bacterium]
MPSSTFADGFGRRFGSDSGSSPPTETLYLCEELSRAPGTEPALQARADRLAAFQHAQVAAVRRIERVHGALTVVSDAVPGVRLADLLRAAERRWLEPDLPSALALLRQVTGLVAALHEHGSNVAHGTLGPERMVVGDDGTVVIVEAVLGGAIERLEMSRTRLWKQYRVAVPPVAGAAAMDQAADVLQLGVLALALTTGRLLGRDDVPSRLPALVREMAAEDPLGRRQPLPRAVRSWVSRALQLDSRAAFRSALEAESALGEALEKGGLEGVSQADVASWAKWATTGERPERRDPPPAVPPAPASSGHVVAAASPVREAAADTPRVPSSPAAVLPARSWRARPRGAPRARARRFSRASALLGALLLLLAGASYVGARSYLGLPPLLFPTGHLMVESHPSGLEVLLDGKPLGSTPVTAEIKAGHYTLALRSSRSTTLVPVTVQAGAWHTERIEVRKGLAPRRTSTIRRPEEEPDAATGNKEGSK